MSRKQKIIISIVGISIVSLALIGLTYGYYLTRIQGNTNNKSIDVTAADLLLVYNDGSDGVVGGENLFPSNTEYTKTFTVKNEGNVNIEYGLYLIDVVNTFERTDDIKYTLDCSTNGTIACNKVTIETTFPNGIKELVTNEIEPKKTHTYTFTFTYKDTGTDQSVDMGKILQAKLQIFSKNINGEFMPYEPTTLAYAIINNAKLENNGTTFSATPLTIPAQEIPNYKYYTDRATEEIDERLIYNVSTTYQGYYWTYGTGYKVDESTGKFTLTGVSTCKYNDGTCNKTLIGKYLVDNYVYNNSSSTDTKKTTTDLENIYKVTEAPVSSTSSVSIKIKKMLAVSYPTESTLSMAEDDYGYSYYYRGGVKDNYIEFNNMCWRVVRVEGDGSIKIILAKEGLCSTITSSDTTSALINNGAKIAYGYKTINSKYYADYENYSGGLYTTLKTWYISSGLEDKKLYLKNEKWCLGGSDGYKYSNDTGALLTTDEALTLENNKSGYLYLVGKRMMGVGGDKTATFKCSSEEDSVSDYIGTLTADEIIYAGNIAFEVYNACRGNYLYTNSQTIYWTLSRSFFFDGYSDSVAYVNIDNSLLALESKETFATVRPSITLATGSQLLSGDGTIDNPYKILEN